MSAISSLAASTALADLVTLSNYVSALVKGGKAVWELIADLYDALKSAGEDDDSISEMIAAKFAAAKEWAADEWEDFTDELSTLITLTSEIVASASTIFTSAKEFFTAVIAGEVTWSDVLEALGLSSDDDEDSDDATDTDATSGDDTVTA